SERRAGCAPARLPLPLTDCSASWEGNCQARERESLGARPPLAAASLVSGLLLSGHLRQPREADYSGWCVAAQGGAPCDFPRWGQPSCLLRRGRS
ncbi:Hypothetical predicted protein, partial [Podarcis lilfordi]